MIYRIKERIKRLWNAGAMHITLGTFATKFVAFFGSIVVVRILSKEDYGIMSYVENIYSYVFIFAGLGLSNAMLRYLVISNNQKEKKQYFNFIIKNGIFRNIVLLIILLILSQIIVFPDNYLRVEYLIPIVALLLPFQDLLNNVLFSIRSFFKNKLYAYLAFFSSTLLIVGRVIGAYSGGVEGVLWSRVIINAVFAIFCLIFVYHTFFIKDRVKPLSKRKVKEVNIYSLQYMVTNGFWALFMLNDTLLLGLLLNDPNGLADYKVAYVLPGNLSIFATAIGVFVSPYFIKNENNILWIRENFKKIFVVNAIIVGGVALFVGLLAEPLIFILYGEKYVNTINLMRVLLLASFLNSGLRYTTANLLASMGKIKYNMIISGGGMVLQILLDVVCIPKFGVMAVAVSNCIVYGLMAITLYIIFERKYIKRSVVA